MAEAEMSLRGEREQAQRELERERKKAGFVEFTVTKAIVVNNKFKGPGTRLMDPSDAAYIAKHRCGHYGNAKDAPKPEPEVFDNGPIEGAPRATLADTARALQEKCQNVERGLPEDFPHRAQLEGAGYVSYEKLRGATEEDLLAIEGIGPAGVKKIGLRLDGDK